LARGAARWYISPWLPVRGYRERLRWWVTRRLAGPRDAVPFAPPVAQALEAAWRWDVRRGE